ncbi:ANTAR domain-containing protein [Nocardia sp. ET3-3]|uniref:ANTAR domain-containing protein n=1 Tax=Nocardia terrae TaxID=2675851 RepID=A0A7K1UQ76_9NOCA|nr:GAF and ANTAR domain-containing protein [Nocardia terrae]MVU76495.1 ANTAR domain-containing protein [Nocardia terrae]
MSYDGPALIAALTRFARLLPTEYGADEALEELVAAESSVLGLTGVGVVMLSQGRLRMQKAAGRHVLAAERCQEQRQQGPCVDAHRSGTVVAVGDLAGCAQRWPQYVAVARQDRIAAVAGIPMRLRDNPIGAVNLYEARPRTWAEPDLEVARVLADTAVGYLVNADRRDRQLALTGQLQQALESRVLIEQAKGVISNAKGITPDEAFALIRQHARARQLRLRTVAHAIIETGLQL